MDVNQIKEWIASGQMEAVEEAWMAAAEGSPPISPKQAEEVLAALVAAGKDDLADTLGWALLEEVKARQAPQQRLDLAKAMATAVPMSTELRQLAAGLYQEAYGTHKDFDLLVKASELVNAPTPRRAFATLDLCLRITDGSFVANRFRNRVLQVKGLDPALREYELEDLAGGGVTLEPRKLADEYDLIDETDFRVLSHRDPERLKELFYSDPAAVLIGICQSREGRIDAVDLKEMLVPRYIEADKWGGWWGRARTAAKRCPHLALEGRNPIFLVYHPGGLSLEQELAADVEAVKTPIDRLELLRRYVREARQRKVDTDPAFAAALTDALARDAGAFVRTRPSDALAASLGLAEAAEMGLPIPAAGGYPTPRDVLAATAEPYRVVLGLENDSLWPEALEALAGLPDAGRDLEAILPLSPMRRLDNLAALLRKVGREEALLAAAGKAIADPLGYLEIILWLWSGPAEPVPGAPGKLEILSRLLKTILDIDVDPQVAVGADRKEIQRRIRTALAARDLAGFREVVAQMDEPMADIIKRRIERTDGLAETVRDEMLRVLRESFFSLFAKARVEPWLDETALYTTVEAMRRYEAELKHLVEVQIPANSRAIGEAASLGDLSENSEWKYAVEERNKFQARQAKMQDELTKTRALHPQEISVDRVNIGTRVTLRRTAGAGTIDMSILGPWDTDLARRRYSYQTALATALLGKHVGETATLKLEGDDAEYTIEAIDVAEF
jgi:transcription elongation factor GreA